MKKEFFKKYALPLFAVILFGFSACSCSTAHTHSFSASEILREPTCTDEGLEKFTCECGYSAEMSIAPTGHVKGEKKTVLAATCTEDGVYKIDCERCGTVLEEGKISSGGHQLIQHEAKEATCSSVGWKKYVTCTNCDYGDYSEIPKTAHVSSGYVDCITPNSCTVCGEIINVACGHTEKTIYGREATCSSEGLTDGKICTVCGTVTVEQRVIPKREHTAEVVEGKAATCESTGLSDGLKCGTCGYVIVGQTEIPRRSHSFESLSSLQCSVCGSVRNLKGEKCIHENQLTLQKVPASCSRYGLTQGITCKDCGEILVQQELIPLQKHTKVTVSGTGATCVRAGLGEGSECSLCGLVIKQQEVIDHGGHTETVDKAVAPTCEGSGLTEGKHCAACLTTTVKQNKISPSGHELVIHEGKEPTCLENGWYLYYTCSRCTYSTFKSIESKGHTEVTDEAVAATCTEKGLGTGRHCKVCGEITLKQAEIAPTGHEYGEWHQVSGGGCTSEATAVRICVKCFAVDKGENTEAHVFKVNCEPKGCTEGREAYIVCEKCNADGGVEELEPVGHDLIWSITSSGHSLKCCREKCGYYTLTEAHRSDVTSLCEDRVCVDCGHVISYGTGHKLSAKYKSDTDYHWQECTNVGCNYAENKTTHTNPTARCTDSIVKCSVCSRYYSPKTSHVMGNWKITEAATCVKTGIMTRQCLNCFYTETKKLENTTHIMGAWYSEGTSLRRNCEVCDYYEVKKTVDGTK